MKSRKIVQLQMNSGNQAALVALCDDGTVWQRSLEAPEHLWVRLPDIPLDAEAETDNPKPANTGQRWESEHDEHLVILWHQQKKCCAEIGELMQRTEGAILSRLAHLDIFPDRESAREADKVRRQRS